MLEIHPRAIMIHVSTHPSTLKDPGDNNFTPYLDLAASFCLILSELVRKIRLYKTLASQTYRSHFGPSASLPVVCSSRLKQQWRTSLRSTFPQRKKAREQSTRAARAGAQNSTIIRLTIGILQRRASKCVKTYAIAAQSSADKADNALFL